MTKSQTVADDVAALLRARNPLLWVVTTEEERVEQYLFEAAAASSYVPKFWDVATGFSDYAGATQSTAKGDPDAALEYIANAKSERRVYILRDFPAWISGPTAPVTLRMLKNLARSLPSRETEQAASIIVISPSKDVPAELSNLTTVLDWPLPDREEIADMLDASIPDSLRKTACPNGIRDAAIDAAVGLSGEEAKATFARSLVQLKAIDPAIIATEKKRAVGKSGILEFFDPLKDGMEAVGGNDNLKDWLSSRATAFSPAARAYGLPTPKGCILVGVPGCGKSLTAKAIGTAWGVPIIRMDLGALKSKYVGESEGNLRQALSQIEAMGRCVVWLDEIEKALDGATSGSADGGVSADALGAILTWMQDRQGEAFVIATANNAEKLPPELLRKGRFDEVWWVDLPTKSERAAIINAALKAHGRNNAVTGKVNPATIAGATESFTGAEIAALVPEAMFAAFNDGVREVTTDDLLQAVKTVVPMAKQQAEKIAALRATWKDRARPASIQLDVEAPVSRGRKLDI